jgi:hypothetical protein
MAVVALSLLPETEFLPYNSDTCLLCWLSKIPYELVSPTPIYDYVGWTMPV